MNQPINLAKNKDIPSDNVVVALTYREYLAAQIASGLASTDSYKVAKYFAEEVVRRTDKILEELTKEEE